jgi:hypothetical protein
LEALYARFPTDVMGVGSATHGEYGPKINVPSPDTWGSLWLRHTDEHKGQVVGYPLGDWAALDGFVPPDTATPAILEAIRAAIARNAGRRYTTADGDIIWQRMMYLHGIQEMLEDLILQPERCAALRDLIVGVMERRVAALCQMEGLDGVAFRDDWGTQEALMISPKLWRSFFKPSYAKLFGMVRAVGKHVWFHSDGVITSIIPDLIEIGVQVFNPQTDCMGRETVAALCAGRLCLQADIDRQWVLPHGTPEDCRAETRADMALFGGPRGGYIGRAQASSDVPLENLAAVYEELLGQ